MPESKVNILVVDDLPEKILTMQVMLEELDETIITADSGRAALRCLLDQDFAVILLDVNMPDMDGFETAALIRQRQRSAHTPIIFLTAYSDEIHTARGYSLGAVDYILSPVLPEILRTKVKVFVDLFKMNEQVKRQAEERIALERAQVARAAAEETTRRTAFLAEASKTLTSSLDYEVTLNGLTRLLVPKLADLTVICLVDEHGQAAQTQFAWTGSWGELCVRSTARGDASQAKFAPLIEQMLAIKAVEPLPAMATLLADERAWEETAANGQAEYPPPNFTVQSVIGVPLQARGRTLGAAALALRPERQLSQADVALVEELAGRAAIALDNARLYRNIQEGDRLKNEFLAMLAHELRNPLAPIRNAVHILKRLEVHREEFHFARDIIDRQLSQMVRLVDDLLDVSRITRGKIILQKERLDVIASATRAVETSRPLIEARQQKLTVELAQGPLWVHGDATRLAQVLANLLNNAAKFTPEGGSIQLTLAREGSEAVFRVRDTGIGIPPDILANVFDLFIQGDRSLDRSQGGLGIGLTLVRRLVEMHGGSVQAHSAGANQGSEFTVRLPLAADEETPTPANGAVAAGMSGRRQRILIVDDNVDSAETLALVLRQNGHDVQTRHDGPSALELAPVYHPEVVLLDIGLPGMDGYEVARRLKQQPGLDSVCLAAITGYGQESDRTRSRAAGFQYHLVKPVDLNALQDMLARRS
jgi:signal transduction histidine kinase/DNA-binding response OmpR family regulator